MCTYCVKIKVLAQEVRESIKEVCYMHFWFSKNNGWGRLNGRISIFHHLIRCIKKQNMPQDAACKALQSTK